MTQQTFARRRYSTTDTVSGKDLSQLTRDLDGAFAELVPFEKSTYTGYASFPFAIGVSKAPFAILAARIRNATDLGASATQGGFCAFTYDARQAVATIQSINALSPAAAALPSNVRFVIDFLVVY